MKACGIALMLSFLVASDAFAHARFRATNAQGLFGPRNNLANKTGPCGSARTNTPTFAIAGSTVTVIFDEFINHPGYYRIAFSPNGDQFPADFNAPANDPNILLNNIPDGGNNLSYTRTLTLPNAPCDRCALQLIQYMTETNPPELYYSCVDLVLLPAGAALPTPNPSPTPLVGGSGTAGSSGSGAGGTGEPGPPCH